MPNINKIIKLLILNITVIILSVVCYSQGYLNLRPSDESILRAGMSIIMFLILIFAFIYGNYKLIFVKKINSKEIMEINDTVSAIKVLKTFEDGKHFGSIAKTQIEQLLRIEKTFDRAKNVINDKFEPNTLSWQKYYSVIDESNNTVVNNVIAMANRMYLFDETKYERLKHYKEDDIPDDVQEKQIELYNKNIEIIKKSFGINEQIILKIDILSLELGAGTVDKEDALLDEITKLTDEIKYYM